MRPRLLRPACFFSGSIRLFSGSFFVISSNVLTLIERLPGEVGLYIRIGICASLSFRRRDQLDLLEDVDALARKQGDNRLLPGSFLSVNPASTAPNRARPARALDVHGVDRLDP